LTSKLLNFNIQNDCQPFFIGLKPLESEDLSYFYSYFHKNQERNPCFQVILGLGIRGFGIRGIFLERNPRE
jgi:hypothetical protein